MMTMLAGARCWGRGYRVECLLPAVQAVHAATDPQAAGRAAGPCRLPLYPRPRIHVHQVMLDIPGALFWNK